MFNFIKKTKQKHTAFSSDNAPLQTAVDQVLQQANQQDPGNQLTGIKSQGESVTLDLRLNGDVDPEEIHRQLGIALQPYGVKEVNLNVTLPPKSASRPANMKTTAGIEPVSNTKGAGNKLPKTTNAAAPKAESASEEPAITKRAPMQSSLQPHPRIKHVIVVASGKGGVGKSTTTVNIALALQKLGNRVGILDADIYGPSMPSMLGVEGVKPQLENEQFVPIEAHGLAMLSIGSLLDGDNTPVAWRGPKATGALMQLFNQTNWPMLDYLVIDMPPGTGDIQLTLAQRIAVTGAVIVTTPQHIALMDAQKGIEMFNKTSIPVIGVVENMALHTCSNCGHTEAIFGAGGGEFIAKEYQVPLLGQLPLAAAIRSQADKGEPSVIANEGKGDDYAEFYVDIAKKIETNIAKFAKQRDDGRIF
ncbi:iron-sulfur cluster carrier protein ApbC [Psychrobacter sp. FDAARGOS_221]|uniref:iron-sulfur cluster carrier protein ApbC n=1 Tax=Psychrobacter sp. FDAARGOS_221 TaxID=1975705 RepID=UPI000BB53C19|nr:iron-sulfur cluster carrier protein ApbC [Psychrobacter sp. FDAARGOS_221]PNK60046.1 iron-sulfur cluster carrier protein ApbC [Psychrobacter sp. FDAARGOS_221]